MRRLLLLSSALVVLLMTIESCKVKKKDNVKEEVATVEERPVIVDSVVRAPGAQNQGELDSIKAALRKKKRNNGSTK